LKFLWLSNGVFAPDEAVATFRFNVIYKLLKYAYSRE